MVAVLLTVGAMNAYFAGGAKLGAALGRDGSLPAWFAQGGQAGQVPRRALAVTTALSLLSLLATALLHLDLTASVLLATGAFTVVYVVGTAAAIRLLPRGTWARRGAVVSFVERRGPARSSTGATPSGRWRSPPPRSATRRSSRDAGRAPADAAPRPAGRRPRRRTRPPRPPSTAVPSDVEPCAPR